MATTQPKTSKPTTRNRVRTLLTAGDRFDLSAIMIRAHDRMHNATVLGRPIVFKTALREAWNQARHERGTRRDDRQIAEMAARGQRFTPANTLEFSDDPRHQAEFIRSLRAA